jgi:K+-transporting ATPase ATPase C chain
MKHILSSVRVMIFFTVLCGLIYPLAMTGFAQIFFKDKANGALVSRGGQLIGSESISQNFEKPGYFWPRPSAVSFNPLPSGGSNLAPTSEALKALAFERRQKLKASNPGKGEPPQHLVFASASGLDPHISLEAALYQVERISVARALGVDVVKNLVMENVKARQYVIFGEETVNVLALNLSLDKMQGIASAPVLAPEPVK